MERDEQIEEMANCLCREYGTDKCNPDCGAHGHCNIYFDCKVLYEAGYRKQSEGEWVVCGMFDDFLKCSCCGDKHPWKTAIEFKYCPNCGAKVKGEVTWIETRS